MQPSTRVSQIERVRTAAQKVLAEAEADAIAPVLQPDYPQPATTYRTPGVPVAPSSDTPPDKLLSPVEIARLKEQNTRQLLRSNYWYEIANIARWCTTGLIGLTGLTIISAAGWAGAAGLPTSFTAIAGGLSTAFLSAAAAPVWACIAALALAAFITVKASQHSRKVFVEKTFDVQDTLMQRQAKLVGHSVEQAVDTHDHNTSSRWSARFMASAAAHAEQVAAEKKPADPQATR